MFISSATAPARRVAQRRGCLEKLSRTMLREFFRFEPRYQLRLAAAVAASGWCPRCSRLARPPATSSPIGEGIGNAHRNAPYVTLITFLDVVSTLGMFVAVALLAQPLLRDFELGTEELFFSKPIRKSSHICGGRFAAGLVMALIAMAITDGRHDLSVSFMPWIDPRSGWDHSLRQPYLWASPSSSFPTGYSAGGLLGLMAVTTRRLLPVLLGVVAFLVLWSIAGSLTEGHSIRHHLGADRSAGRRGHRAGHALLVGRRAHCGIARRDGPGVVESIDLGGRGHRAAGRDAVAASSRSDNARSGVGGSGAQKARTR